MKLPQMSVSRPVTVTMIFLGILLIAIYCIFKLPVDLYPDIEPPMISVIIAWPGASAEDVEQKVSEVAENQLAIVNGLDEITSTSKEGISVVRLKFDWGTNLDEASNEIRDRLDFATSFLPKDIEKPTIFKFNTSMMPVIFYGMSADTNWNNLWDVADDYIVKELQRVPGVGSVQSFGGRERQVSLRLDPAALRARNISLEEIDEKISAANVTRPAGSAKVGRVKYNIRIPAEFQKPEEIEDIIVKTDGDAAVYMRDLITDRHITLGFAEKTQIVTVDGKEAMFVMVQKRSGANSVDVTRRVQERMEEIRKNLPRDVRVYELFNTSSFIKDSLTNLALTAGWGGVFVILITLFFLRNIRNSIVVVVTIPFSLIIAFIFLYVLGFTINIISLASIAIGVGMVVDNAIVVLENIARHVEKGERVREASVFATGEVGTAISASTYTTVVIFLPLLFLTGFVGIIFKQLALAVTVTILASLFCALTLSPMLASKLMKPAGQTLPKSPLLRRLFIESENAFLRVETAYSRLLGWALGHKWTVLIIAGIALAVAVGMGRYVGTEFMPAQDSGSLDISYRLKVGTKVEDTLVVGRFIEDTVREIGGPAIIHTHMTVGESSSGLSGAFGNEEGSHIGSVSARFIPVSKRKLRAEDYGQMIVEKVKSSQWGPYIEKVYYNTGNRLDALMSGSAGQPISMEVMGYDIDKAYALANQLRDIIAATPGARNPTVSLELGKPELQIIIDRLKAEDVGADVSTMARDIDTLYRGTDISTFRKGSREYDIELRLAPQYRENTERIIDTVVTLRGGSQIVAATVAKMVRERGPVTIERLNRQRVIRVEASAFQRSLGEVVADAGNKIKELKAKGAIPEGFSVEQGGSYKEQQKSFGDMTILLGMGIVLVFMVMASQFESIKQPFIIMFSVPFAFVGVVVLLVATHTTLNLMSFIGAVLLVGVVVNNAIVLLDYTNILRARGIGLVEAIKQAGANRLRPVLMTTLTTIFGMLPLAVAPGEGSETWQPMAIAVIGGLSLSTLVTLVLIPVLYSIWERKDKQPVRT